LIGYGEGDNHPLTTSALFESVLAVLLDFRSHVGGEDIVLWLGKKTLLQLPAETVVRRYLQQRDVINERLRYRYPSSEIGQRLLFPAAKSSLRSPRNGTETEFLPKSTLPRDVYGSLQKESLLETRFTRPRHILAASFMGKADDVTSLLGVLLEGTNSSEGHFDEAAIWPQLFLRQERARQERARANQTRIDQARSAMTRLVYKQPSALHGHNTTPNHTALPTLDLGIHLDYESRIFQPITNDTTNDIHPLTFRHPVIASTPSRSAAHLYRDPVRLPPELMISQRLSSFLELLAVDDVDGYVVVNNSNTPPPAADQSQAQGNGSDNDLPDLIVAAAVIGRYMDKPRREAATEEEQLLSRPGRRRNVTWGDVPFWTNVVVPRGSVPGVLVFEDGDGLPGGDGDDVEQRRKDSGDEDETKKPDLEGDGDSNDGDAKEKEKKRDDGGDGNNTNEENNDSDDDDNEDDGGGGYSEEADAENGERKKKDERRRESEDESEKETVGNNDGENGGDSQRENKKDMFDQAWEGMWFREYGRVLLEGCWLRPDSKALAIAVARGTGYGAEWNTRGGRGGVWTDLGMCYLSPSLSLHSQTYTYTQTAGGGCS